MKDRYPLLLGIVLAALVVFAQTCARADETHDANAGSPAGSHTTPAELRYLAQKPTDDKQSDATGSDHDEAKKESGTQETYTTAGGDSKGKKETSKDSLANLEELVNVIANGLELCALSAGVNVMLLGIVLLFLPDRRKLAFGILPLGLLLVGTGLAIPGAIQVLIDSARDAQLFS